VDYSESALEIARERAVGLDCRYEVGQIPPIPSGPFDVVLLLETLLAFADKEPLLREISAALRPGGRFAFTLEEGEPLTTPEGDEMPDADTVWLTPLPDILAMLERAGLHVTWQVECSDAHLAVVDSLISAFESERSEIAAQIGDQAVDELLAAHRLWSDWLREGRVRKFAFVAEKSDEVGISVAIPALNAETTIADQLAAVLAQDCPVPFEVVVADNGSSDGTRRIVEEMAARDPRVRLIDASAVRGEAVARNAAAEACRAPLVAFCDADDVVQPGWLAAIHDALRSGAHAVTVMRDYGPLNPQRSDVAGEEMVISSWIAGGAFAVRRDLYLELGGFDPSMPTAADTEFGFRMLDRVGRPPKSVPAAVVSVRQQAGLLPLFMRTRAVSLTRDRLRRDHPQHIVSSSADVARFRLMLLQLLVTKSPWLLSARRRNWVEVLAILEGDIEGSVAGRLTSLG
jgi:hypothetical protein